MRKFGLAAATIALTVGLGGCATQVTPPAAPVTAAPTTTAAASDPEAQDMTAKQQIAVISMGQAESLSVSGAAKTTVSEINDDPKIRTKVKLPAGTVVGIATSDDGKHFAVVVESESGRYFARVDGGDYFDADTLDGLGAAVAPALDAAAMQMPELAPLAY